MKVALLLGSIRIGRQSHKIAHYLKGELIKRGIEADLIDLATDVLPMLEERAGMHKGHPAVVAELGRRLEYADGIIFITPEYHGSFSGVLKNALDYYWREFQRKPIGVVTVSRGMSGGMNASIQLQHIILSLGAYPLPVKLLVPEIHKAFDDQFSPQHESVIRNTEKFIDSFLWLADAIYRKKTA